MKTLINLIILIGLCYGGFYAYQQYNEDYQLQASINNFIDNTRYDLREWYEEARDEMRRNIDDLKRVVGR